MSNEGRDKYIRKTVKRAVGENAQVTETTKLLQIQVSGGTDNIGRVSMALGNAGIPFQFKFHTNIFWVKRI